MPQGLDADSGSRSTGSGSPWSDVDPATSAGLALEFRALAERLAQTQDTQAALRRLVELAPEVLDGCDWAGLTQHSRREGFVTPAASSPTTLDVDRVQYALREGPCVDAVRADGLYYSPDLSHETRWPAFSTRTLETTDVRSVLSLTVSPASPRAALNLYGHEPQAFAEPDLDVATLFAAHAQILLQNIRATNHVTQLHQALKNSRLIGIAVGILMYAHRLSADEAFERLKASSQRLNRKLADIAAYVAETGQMPPSER